MQDDATELHAAQAIFDTVVTSYMDMELRIEKKATIVRIMNFEDALVRIQSKQESQMTKWEERTVRHLLNPINVSTSRAALCSVQNKKLSWAKELFWEDKE